MAVLAGCGSGSDPEAASPAVASSGKTLWDDSGHPLSSPTDDAGVLYFESEVTRLVNAHRVAIGLNALVDSADLRDVTRGHARHMVVHRFFGHESPEGRAPSDRLDGAGIAWSLVGENLGAAYATPETVFNAWMASPGHRAAIEYEGWTHTGVGYAEDAAADAEFPHVHVWAQTFLKR